MSNPPSNPLLVIGISTRALFALEEEHRVFEASGVEAYAQLQRRKEGDLLAPGTGFELVHRLLALNRAGGPQLVDVILLSRNSPDLSVRAFRSAERYGLTIARGGFTSGRPVAPYIDPYAVDLFLSNDHADVTAAGTRTAAARLAPYAEVANADPPDEIRIALDGDAVVFEDTSERIFKDQGIEAFVANERANVHVPLKPGPFGMFMQKLAALRARSARADGTSRIRIAIVTARSAATHERIIRTLRAWGTPADEAHFLSGCPKGPIVRAFGAHIFFDDQVQHVLSAAASVPAGLVPSPWGSDAPLTRFTSS